MYIIRIIIVIISWSGAAFAGPYDGIYRPDADWAEDWDCKSVGKDGGALEIRDDKYLGIGSVCSLKKGVGVRDMDAMLYDVDCEIDGEQYTYRLLMMATSAGIAMITDGAVVQYLRRCE